MVDTRSYWLDNQAIESFHSLSEDIQVDICIVGGGITGITTAYALAQAGKRVAVLEADRLLSGTTGHTTAKITAQHDLIYDELIQHFGSKQARAYYQANQLAIQLIEERVNKHQIACQFEKQDAYLYAITEQYGTKLVNEANAYQRLGINGGLVKTLPINLTFTKALVMKEQAQFNPISYLNQLVKEANANGTLFYERTTAVNVEKTAESLIVETLNQAKVSAKHVIACSHFPFYEGAGLYSTRLYAERSYLIACKVKEPYPGGMYLGVDQPGRSIRSVKNGDETVVLIGGEQHKTGQGGPTCQHFAKLETFGETVFDLAEVTHKWSAQDLTTLDKIPYIGPITADQPQLLIATGFRKWGMTTATLAAELLRDYVMDRSNPFHKLFAPSRFQADPSLKQFLIQNANVAKHLIKGKFEHPTTDIDALAKGEGAVVTVDGERKGAYRDHADQVHLVDTTCTHVGCEVNWNEAEESWDCPCHGSRFSYTGEVIEGPAEKPLKHGHYDMLGTLTDEDSGY
ncbi:Glycine/D-amino acid oxidase [Amphibacillus marinus]|uniref:Glycine/D-amino acid oxidase n=1 Tax=Amphibacillus marinus TaxID=872970 RepID=A0A1H8RHK8_9BACI|nr:FAD-dependent oxidoreductase [Amphibacillus marinus]SEO65792.1 Glycine/D-amino acid oxidase [Amphibacillus marinus]